jgi:hypothetical protein
MIKIEKPNVNSSITNEAYYTRILNEDHHMTCIAKYYGDNFHNKRNYIIMEYIDSTIDYYMKLPKQHSGK